MSVVHRGNGFPFLAQPVFEYLISGSYNSIYAPPEEIPDPVLQFVIVKVIYHCDHLMSGLDALSSYILQINKAENDDELRRIFAMDEVLDLLMIKGFHKAISKLSIADRSDLIAALLDYHLMAKVKAEMDQFLEGLSTFQFLDTCNDK